MLDKMRKIIFLIVVLGSSCMTLEYIPAYEQTLGIDLRPFAEQDFLITPYAYSGKYTSIAVIDYKIMPRAQLKTTGSYSTYTGEYYGSRRTWLMDTIKIDESLNRIFLICREM